MSAEELRSIDLGIVLKNIPNSEFGMESFGDRLRLQKIIYIIQAHGVYLGYTFAWYLRGPYCSKLARTGFALVDRYDRIDKARMDDTIFDVPEMEKKFKKACNFIKKNNDNDSLEIVASIHLLKKTTNMSLEAIFTKVASKRPQFNVKKCQDMWQTMQRGGLADE